MSEPLNFQISEMIDSVLGWSWFELHFDQSSLTDRVLLNSVGRKCHVIFFLLTLVIFFLCGFVSCFHFLICVLHPLFWIRWLIRNQLSKHILNLFSSSPMSCHRLAACALVRIWLELMPEIFQGMLMILHIFVHMPTPYLLVSWVKLWKGEYMGVWKGALWSLSNEKSLSL